MPLAQFYHRRGGNYTRTPEIRQKQSLANKKAWENPEIRQCYLGSFSDRIVDYPRIEAMHGALAKCRQDIEWVKRWKGAQPKTHKHYYIKDKEHYSAIQSAKNKGRVFTTEHRMKLSLASQNRPPVSKEQRERQSKVMKAKWQDVKYARWAASRQNRRPNRLEQRLMLLLDKEFPNEWRYVGDGQVWIEGRNPDFININGRKIVIELLGDYWHTTKAKITPQERVEHYKEYGFKCITIWQSQMKDLDIITDIIKETLC